MGFAEDLAVSLSTGLGWPAGWNGTSTAAVFVNEWPDQPDTAAAVFETGGLSPALVFDSTSVAWRNPTVQILTRSTSQATARAAAETAVTRFATVSNSIVPGASSGSTYLDVRAQSDVISLGRDDAGRAEFSVNFTGSY